jgi:hypothetical protein
LEVPELCTGAALTLRMVLCTSHAVMHSDAQHFLNNSFCLCSLHHAALMAQIAYLHDASLLAVQRANLYAHTLHSKLKGGSSI